MKNTEWKLTWPRRDRNEDQHQVFRSRVSLENKMRKLGLAGYTGLVVYSRSVVQGSWEPTGE